MDIKTSLKITSGTEGKSGLILSSLKNDNIQERGIAINELGEIILSSNNGDALFSNSKNTYYSELNGIKGIKDRGINLSRIEGVNINGEIYKSGIVKGVNIDSDLYLKGLISSENISTIPQYKGTALYSIGQQHIYINGNCFIYIEGNDIKKSSFKDNSIDVLFTLPLGAEYLYISLHGNHCIGTYREQDKLKLFFINLKNNTISNILECNIGHSIYERQDYGVSINGQQIFILTGLGELHKFSYNETLITKINTQTIPEKNKKIIKDKGFVFVYNSDKSIIMVYHSYYMPDVYDAEIHTKRIICIGDIMGTLTRQYLYTGISIYDKHSVNGCIAIKNGDYYENHRLPLGFIDTNNLSVNVYKSVDYTCVNDGLYIDLFGRTNIKYIEKNVVKNIKEDIFEVDCNFHGYDDLINYSYHLYDKLYRGYEGMEIFFSDGGVANITISDNGMFGLSKNTQDEVIKYAYNYLDTTITPIKLLKNKSSIEKIENYGYYSNGSDILTENYNNLVQYQVSRDNDYMLGLGLNNADLVNISGNEDGNLHKNIKYIYFYTDIYMNYRNYDDMSYGDIIMPTITVVPNNIEGIVTSDTFFGSIIDGEHTKTKNETYKYVHFKVKTKIEIKEEITLNEFLNKINTTLKTDGANYFNSLNTSTSELLQTASENLYLRYGDGNLPVQLFIHNRGKYNENYISSINYNGGGEVVSMFPFYFEIVV